MTSNILSKLSKVQRDNTTLILISIPNEKKPICHEIGFFCLLSCIEYTNLVNIITDIGTNKVMNILDLWLFVLSMPIVKDANKKGHFNGRSFNEYYYIKGLFN
jgi:hypothetical protein